uniref:AF4/FMR2 family member lilli n=1 Tax=Eptatretus burgeri TaxID=7764 RepID=A0A8C4RA37_EPTBU
MDSLHNSSGKTSPNWVHMSQSATMPIASDASTPIYDAAEGSGGGGGGGCAELTGLSMSGTSSESEESDSESSSNSSGERKMNHATRDNSPESEPPSSANKWQLKKWMTKVMPLEGGQGSPCMFLSDKGLCHVVPPTMPGGTLALPTTLTTSTTSCISFEQTEADVTNDHRPNVISKTQPNDTLSPQRLVGWKQPKGYRIQGAAVQSTNDEHKIQLITPTNSSLSSKFTKLQGSYKQPHTSQHFSKQSVIVDHGKERLWKKPKMDRPVSELQMPHVNHWNVPKSVGFVDFDSPEHSESGSDSDGEILPTKPGVTLTHNFTSNTEEEEMHIQRAMSLLSPLFPNSQLLSPIHEDTLPMVSPGRLRKAVGLHKSPTLHAWLSRTDMTDQNSSFPAHDQNVSIPKTTNDNESHWALSKNLQGHKVGARANDCNQDSNLTAAQTRDLHPEFSHTDSWPPEENLVDQLLVRWDLALISHSAEETPQKQDQEHCGNLASQELSTPVLPLVQKRKCKNVRDRQEHRKKSRWNDDTENQKISRSQSACSPSHISISYKKSNSSKLAGEKDKWRKTTSSSSFLQQKPNSKPHKAEVERRGSSTYQPLKAEPLPSRKFEAPLKRPEREQSNVQGTVSTLKDVPISNGCGRRNGSTAEVTPGKRKSFHPTEHRCATLDLSTPLQNGHRKEKRSRVMLDNMGGSLDQRLQEARKMKHKADNMVDPSWKAVTYMQAALFYIECGIVMEEDSIEAKMVYNMYCKTLEIIRHAISLQKFATSNASSNDKKLSTICYRCLSLLYLHLFCFKKDSALKYSKILMDHFKVITVILSFYSANRCKLYVVMLLSHWFFFNICCWVKCIFFPLHI